MSPYEPGTKSELHDYFNRDVAGLKLLLESDQGIEQQESYKKLAQENKTHFIAGIEAIIKESTEGRIPVTGRIGEPQLREILEVARNYDWTEPSTIERLYGTYLGIAGDEFDEGVPVERE